MALEISRGELQLWFKPHSDRRSEPGDMSSQSPGVQPETNSGLLLGSPGKKCHSDVAPMEQHRKYYMGEGGGFPRVRALVSQNESKVACGLSQHQMDAE